MDTLKYNVQIKMHDRIHYFGVFDTSPEGGGYRYRNGELKDHDRTRVVIE